MRTLLVNLFYWFLDYAYVVKEEIARVIDTTKPSQFRFPGGKPVLLIPGVYETWHFVKPIAKLLHSSGYDVHIVDGLGNNKGTVYEMAEVVNDYINLHHLTQVTIISHSKGGLIGKYLLGLVKDQSKIRKLIALNAPYSGTRYAYLLPVRSLRIFVPNSQILKELALDKENNKRIVSLYGLFDPHIPGGSVLEGAKNVQVKTRGHFRILNDPSVHKAILENIE